MIKHRNRLRYLFFIVPLLMMGLYGVVTMTRADWTLTSTAAPVSLGHGATMVTKNIAGPGGASCELTLVFFDESQCEMQVSSNTSKKDARSVEAIASEAGAIAACNGGYFDPPKMLPTGLEIASGVRTGAFDTTLPFGGVLQIKDGKSSIVTSEEFVDGSVFEGLIQCCPRLVEKGKVIEDMGESDPAVRTFILTDGNGRWAIGTSKSIPLLDLARVLCNPKILSELQVQRALNLDGGPSTALWCKYAVEGGKTSIPEKWKVRNVVLILPRKPGK